ncbi:MAG: TonB-dependent receptor plug domain-containing protein [Nitrosomonadales bacterium]|jgi:iron complex outermembrane receptor protein|nr:TonB-dependent receptor plug domain-containing protein [Nitrosomonadales bacterium]
MKKMKKIIAGVFINFLIANFAIAENRIEGIDITKEFDVPFSDNELGIGVSENEKIMSNDTGKLIDNFLGGNSIHNGGFSSLPMIQGLSDDRIKIKIDGMDLIASCANHMNAPLSYSDPVNIKNISVLAGLSAVDQGGDNIGGVIKIDTVKPIFSVDENQIFSGQFGTKYKSNNKTISANISLNTADQDTALSYFGSYVKAENYYAGGTFKDAGLAASDRGWLDSDEVGSTAYKNQNHQVSFSKVIDNEIYQVIAAYHDSPYENFDNQRMDSVGNKNYQLNLSQKGEYEWGKLTSRIYVDDTNHKHNFGPDKQYTYNNMSGQSYGMPMEADGITAGLAVDTEIFLNDQDTLKVGSEIQYYQLDDTWASNSGEGMMTGNAFLNINNGKRNRFDIYGQLDSLWTENWITSLGARLGIVQTDSDDVHGYNQTNNMGSNQLADSDTFNASKRKKTDENIDISLLTRYNMEEDSSIELGYSMKTRSPNLYQRYTWSTWTMAANMNNLYGDGNGYVGNIDLEPETAHKIGLVLNHQDDNKNWRIKINPYYTYISDYIDANVIANRGDGYRNLKFDNQTATIYGLDVGADMHLFRTLNFGNFNLLSKFNYQKGRNTDADTDLYNMMPPNLTLAINQNVGSWNNSLSMLLVDKKDNVNSTRQERETAGFTKFDFVTSYQWESVSIIGEVENILDKSYADPLGGEYLGQGATMSTGITRANGTQVYAMGRSFNVALSYSF